MKFYILVLESVFVRAITMSINLLWRLRMELWTIAKLDIEDGHIKLEGKIIENTPGM